MKTLKPIILGCSGPELLAEEAVFFSQLNPLGFILFQRNCVNPEQLIKLTGDLRKSVGRDDTPIFIDQEGGRVARLKPPHWPELPPLRRIGIIYENDPALGRMAMHLHALVTARMLHDVGINGNCAPILDLYIEGASTAIGDRALSANPDIVADCGRVAMEAYLKNGVLPVIKHIPGHGRVKVDPHVTLPYVDTPLSVLDDNDFRPFMSLCDAPIAMNCHVVFKDLDPKTPVSMSKIAHDDWIRGHIGFDGLLLSDDLAMGALNMPLRQRAQAALTAGADIALYCTGNLREMQEVCADLPDIHDVALSRWIGAKQSCTNLAFQSCPNTMKRRLDTILSVDF